CVLLRTEPFFFFMVAAISFFGMATFEGPILSFKSVSAVAHYTVWLVALVHGGALGWNGFLTFAIIFYLVPRMWKTNLYSKNLANMHFWIGLTGILFYYTSMMASGFTQGIMWKMISPNGTLVYPDFVESVTKIIPLYWARAFGGILFLAGFLIMVYNIYKTISQAPALENEKVTITIAESPFSEQTGHRKLEGMATVFSILTLLAILVGSVIEIYPTLSIHRYVKPNSVVIPYSALEIAGRDIYIREGCYTCHSQMIRHLDFDVLRYGKASTVEESMYDRPFQWGSKRTGPDLARVGKKYPDLWHFRHMIDPRSVTPQSIMPSYPWLAEKEVDFLGLRKRLSVMKYLGVPYSDEEVSQADRNAEAQAKTISAELEKQNLPAGYSRKEILALIAYLQSLGQKTGETK
ncbi:MAG: cytochrome-c oxidase, cbb3-type subunit II, partial [Pseudobdellovibrionaceae bacterium]